MLSIDTERLDQDGFVILPSLLQPGEIIAFENAIARFAAAQANQLGLTPNAQEPFVAVFSRGGQYTKRIYKLLERLAILHRMAHRIGEELEHSGFLSRAGVEVPLIWPDIRADIPDDRKRSLPVHQDIASTQCAKAWRLWIALRPANAHTGSMAIYPGTHRHGLVPHRITDAAQPEADPKFYSGVEPIILDLAAGDGVLMNPLVLHASVLNRSDRTKFTLMLQVQDFASVIDPDDPRAKLAEYATALAQARAAADM